MKPKLELVTADEVDKFNNQYPRSIRVDERGFYISTEAVSAWNITVGQYMHLIKGKNEKGIVTSWYIVFNDIKEGGSKVSAANHGAVLICARPLSRLFQKGASCAIGDTFYLKDTASSFEGSDVIEILTIKAITRLKRNVRAGK